MYLITGSCTDGSTTTTDLSLTHNQMMLSLKTLSPFIFLALLNEAVWRTQPETTWVNFKVWGMLPITIIFTAMQLPLINRYKL